MFLAVVHVSLLFLICEISGVLWTKWFQLCCRCVGSHSCQSSLFWHESCKKSLKQITGLCGPRGSKIDATMDSTLLFVTAGKHDENVRVMLLWTYSWSVGAIHSRPTVTTPSLLSSNKRCVSLSYSGMAPKNVGWLGAHFLGVNPKFGSIRTSRCKFIVPLNKLT